MELNPENIQAISNWMSKQMRQREPQSNIDPDLIDYLDSETLIRCPVCLDIPRFPIIFPCGHLECHFCYLVDFKVRGKHRGTKFFSPCPECRAEVNPELVWTIENEIKIHMNSKISNFYSNLRVQCDNNGCNKFFFYSLLTKHEMLQCKYRDICCPSENCPCIGHPDSLLTHSANCPLNSIWCRVCNESFSIIYYSHNCSKVLQRKVLLGLNKKYDSKRITKIYAQPTGTVVLPEIIKFQSPDEASLLSIRYLVRQNRHKFLLTSECDILEVDSENNDRQLQDQEVHEFNNTNSESETESNDGLFMNQVQETTQENS